MVQEKDTYTGHNFEDRLLAEAPYLDQEAYLHLWRYIGWLLGVSEANNPCCSAMSAKAWLESIIMHILEPDEDSIAVAHHLLRC